MQSRMSEDLTQPDWELVDHFAATYGILKTSPKFSPEFLEAQQHLQENALAFIENCAWIMVHATHQHVRLKLNAPQLILWDEFERAWREERPLLINLLKYRRWGASTLVAIFFAFRALIYPNTMTLILPKERGPGKQIVKMYETFFDFLFHGVHEDRKARYARYQPDRGIGGRTGERLVFGDPLDGTLGLNCEIEMMVPKEAGRQGTGSIARGVGAQNVHGTEVAHWPNLDAALGAFMPVVPDNPASAVIFETTSSGAGTAYHNFWNECAAGELPFTNLFIGWADDPRNRLRFQKKDDEKAFLDDLGGSDDSRYGNEIELLHEYKLDAEQLNWRRRTMGLHCKGNLATFNQEYPLTAEMAFAQSGEHFIASSRMWFFLDNTTPPKRSGRFADTAVGTPLFNDSAAQPLWRLWEDREEWSQYFICCDFATNEEAKDHIAATVYKEMEFRHVATFRGDDSYRPRLNEATDQIVAGARYFNNALVIPERNGLGAAFIERAMGELNYQNIISEADWRGDVGDNPRFGVPTHRGNRQAMMEELKYLYEQEQDWEIYDELVLREVQELRPVRTHGSLVKVQAPKKGQPRRPNSSERGFYDDLAMTNAMAAWIRGKLPKPKTKEELRKIAREREARFMNVTRQLRDTRIDAI